MLFVFMFLTSCATKVTTQGNKVREIDISWKNSCKYLSNDQTSSTFKVGATANYLSVQNNIRNQTADKGGNSYFLNDFSSDGMGHYRAMFEIYNCPNEKNSNENKLVENLKSKSEFPNQPINVQFKSISKRPDDIAVIIGNANYEKQGKDIPNVNPAYADAEGVKRYFMQAKGIKEGNIIYLKDATAAQISSVFGNQNTHKGQLYNWVKKESNVYVYYAGHGVPGGDKGNAYLVPTDADAKTIDLSGYPLETLYSNLGKLSAKSITVILEACFSGASQAGNLFANSSPIVITAKKTMIPKNVKVISAGAVDQMASWEKDKSHGLFTKYFLKAMSGEGDKNNDGKVSDTELKNYLGETMTYYARRYYGRDQNVQIMQGN